MSFQTIINNAITQLREREKQCLKAASKQVAGSKSNSYWMMQYYEAKHTRQVIQTRDMDTIPSFKFIDEVKS